MKNKKVSLIICILSIVLASCGSPVVNKAVGNDGAKATLPPTATPGPTPIQTQTQAPIPSFTPTSTEALASFVQDINADLLGWKNALYNYYFPAPNTDLLGLNIDLINNNSQNFQYSFDEKGLDLSLKIYPENKYVGAWLQPEKVIKIKGDFDIEVTFDRRMRFSGLWFSKDPTRSRNQINQFAIMTDQGASYPDWETAWNKKGANLGVLVPSKGAWTWIGEKEIEPFLKASKGVISLYLSFSGDQMSVKINGSPFASVKNKMFSGLKYFMGYIVGNGDHFVVTSTKIWVDNIKDLEIKNPFIK
jgi:hypothetical protein